MAADTRGLTPAAVLESEDLTKLRQDVHGFVTEWMAAAGRAPVVDGWLTAWDEAFSRDLGERGWIGMTIPRQYGGGGRSFMERFVVTEELLVAGAPVMAHWVADRQIAPALLRYGTEEQRERYLPQIARGRCYFAIGMSEPDSGSDLASVRTRARRTDSGWLVSGTKVWTSGAQRAQAFIVLARTSPADASRRHEGLSQLIVELDAPGVTVRPIQSMSGESHFNEVHLEDVFVPDGMVLGAIGEGWRQVTAELGFERSGPERFLSTFPLVAQLASGAVDLQLGRLVARLTALHHMSQAVSAALVEGQNAEIAAAVVKVLGTSTEGDVVELADALGGQVSGSAELRDLTRAALLARPGFTLRGGTNEILRGVIARGLGLR